MLQQEEEVLRGGSFRVSVPCHVCVCLSVHAGMSWEGGPGKPVAPQQSLVELPVVDWELGVEGRGKL